MTFKDFLYSRIDDIGLPEDISYQTLIKIEEVADEFYKNKNVGSKDTIKLLEISMKMVDLLEKCRSNKLPIKLAKEIDDLLKELSYLE
jgi:hypothetical protein